MRALIVAGAMALPAVAGAQEAAKPGDGFDVERYDLVLRPNIAQASLSGEESITLRATQAVNALSFSPNALTISNARAGKAAVRVEQDDTAIRFHLARPLTKGERVTLQFALSGKPKRGWIVSGNTVTTSYFACDWMVCLQDSPGDKALFNLDLWLAPGMASVASGKPSAVVKQGDTERHRWRATTAWSPYIYGFAAGRFTEASERAGTNRFRYLMPVNASATPLPTLFAPTAAMTAFFEEKAGKPLPGRRYTQIALPGGEAQEAADFSVIGLDYLDERIANPAEDWANAHELAHQWWGNSITAANWQEFWLNEGLVTFMTAAWKEKAHGRAAYNAEMALARRRLQGVRDKGWDRPLAFKGKYPDLGTRRAIQYSKGALFLDTLRQELGDAAFWRGIKLYSQRHWNGSVTSHDFEKAMRDASGKDLSALFAQWVHDGAPQP